MLEAAEEEVMVVEEDLSNAKLWMRWTLGATARRRVGRWRREGRGNNDREGGERAEGEAFHTKLKYYRLILLKTIVR